MNILTIDLPPKDAAALGAEPGDYDPLFSPQVLDSAFGLRSGAIETASHTGEFPPPDVVVGNLPFWRRSTVIEWLREDDRKRAAEAR